MEIRKEDLVKFHIVDTVFYAFDKHIFDKEEIPETIEEVDKELELQKEKDAKLIEEMKLEKEKEEKKAKLMAELAALEE